MEGCEVEKDCAQEGFSKIEGGKLAELQGLFTLNIHILFI